jgi:hypothetical protein
VFSSFGRKLIMMKCVDWVAPAVIALLIAAFGSHATAETKLTDFNGTWRGGGTDRSVPFEPAQRTNCRANNKADLRRMSTSIVCNGAAGLDKVIRIDITLAGDAFSGQLTQKATTRGDSASASVLKGSVSGHKTDITANFTVSFPGLTPSVAVTLKLNRLSSFSMHATTLGGELMNIVFDRIGKP